MAYETPRLKSVKSRSIEIEHLELPRGVKSYLTSAATATDTTLTIVDNSGFSNSQPILIGKLGEEGTEIKKVNAAVSAGTSLTSTAITFNHSVGSPVQRVLFNQWKIYGASTLAGSKTLIATIDMDISAEFTTYVNPGTEYNFYFVLPSDSLNSIDGDTYSDGLAKDTSHASGTVGSLIKKALAGAKTKMGGEITYDWLLGEINDCLRFMSGKLKHWSGLQKFDYALGTVLRGSYSYSLPTDMEDRNSNKSVLGIRIGTGEDLIYKDKREWEELLKEVKYTQVRTEAAVGATTLEIDNSYDFDDSGTVDIFVSGTKYSVTYTGVTRSQTAGVLTGVPASGTGSISVTVPVDTGVWQTETEGQPVNFTIYDGSLYIWKLPDSNYDNMNLWLDYYTVKTEVDSDSDTLEFQRYDAVKHWLIAKLRAQNNASGQLNLQDGDWAFFNQILQDMMRKEVSGQKWKMKPKINKISY